MKQYVEVILKVEIEYCMIVIDLYCSFCIGSSMVCSDIWHKYLTSDILKLLYVISRAVRRVKFVTILKYHEWYLCQISRTNHATSRKRYEIFTGRYFKLS